MTYLVAVAITKATAGVRLTIAEATLADDKYRPSKYAF